MPIFRLENLSIKHAQNCVVHDENKKREGVFSYIQLIKDDPELRKLFFEVIQAFLKISADSDWMDQF